MYCRKMYEIRCQHFADVFIDEQSGWHYTSLKTYVLLQIRLHEHHFWETGLPCLVVVHLPQKKMCILLFYIIPYL